MESDIQMWERELREAGWRPWRHPRGHENNTIWVSPRGQMYRGPYGAWRVMQSIKQWGDTALPEAATKQESVRAGTRNAKATLDEKRK